MFGFLSFTRYQIRQIKGYSAIAAVLIVSILLLGNLITALVRDHVTVDKNSYMLKKGFPIFLSQKKYVALIKRYPYNTGVKLSIHTMHPGETFWDLARKYHVSIDTIIGANPFITSLVAGEYTQLVIPAKDGLLFPFDDFLDVRAMTKALHFKGSVKGSYLPTPFKLISTDDIRFVFFPGAKPVVVNNAIASLYNIRQIFQKPLKGNFSSLFGERVDPFSHGNMKFHNGVDIIALPGTPIRPTRAGIVVFSGWRDGYGNAVMVQHDDGYTTLYGHCSKLLVRVGDWVTKDTVIACVGATGLATGPHLHFTIMRHGKEIDPLPFIW